MLPYNSASLKACIRKAEKVQVDNIKPGCTNNNMQHTQAHDDVSLMLATFDTPMYLPNRCC